MSYDYFRKLCQDVAFAAGVKFHPRMARHTYATDLLKAGVSVVYVSQLLGHEDLESTSIYLHPSQYDAIQVARSVDLFPTSKIPRNRTVWTGGEQNVRSRWNQEDLQEKIFLLAYLDSNMHHPLSSGVAKHAPLSPEQATEPSDHNFFASKHAPPREQKCTTKDAPPVRWTP